VGGLRVMWTYRIVRNLLPASGSCRGNHRGRSKEEGDCPLARVARGNCHGNQRGKRKGEGEVESP
jgi:hypothetical protein